MASSGKKLHALNMKVMLLRVALYLVAFVLLVSCGKHYDEVKARRVKDVNKSDTINIAVIWDKSINESMLSQGIILAADEINEKGGLFGRPVNIRFYHARNDKEEQQLALKVAKDTSNAAVIGHRSSENAILASVIYEYYGLLFLSPSSSRDNLTNHNFGYTFRTISSDHYVSAQIAAFMKSQGHKKIAIVDDRSLNGDGIANAVAESLADNGLSMVVRRQYTPGKTDFKQFSAELLRYDFDALFVGAMLPQGADFIREARQMGLKQRLFGGYDLDSRSLEKIAGNAANGTVVPTSFNVDLDNQKTQDFVRNFKKRFEKPPGTLAALGYDSLKLFLDAVKRGKTADPTVVASHLRFFKDWEGVAGNYTFDLKGDLINKESYFKYLNQTRFVYFDAPDEEEDEDDD